MLLTNLSKRLITINAPLLNGQRATFFRVKCGTDNTCEVPDELCRNAFVRGLVASDDLSVSGDLDDQVVVDKPVSEYDKMTKVELTDLAEASGIEVESRWTKSNIIEQIEELE